MTPQEQLEWIKKHFKNMNNFGWPEDVRWLIARVEQLEKALKEIEPLGNWDNSCGDIAIEALTTGPEPVSDREVKK